MPAKTGTSKVRARHGSEQRTPDALPDPRLAVQAYATHIGLALPAAKSRVQRARKRLQSQLVSACQVKFDAAGKVCCFVPRPPLSPDE